LMSKELRLAGINPVRNMAPLDFLRALLGCKVLVGNSSVGIRECSFLGVPVVNIGTRQQGRERAKNVFHVQMNHDNFSAASCAEPLREQIMAVMSYERPGPSTLYGDGHAGKRIAGILAGAELRRVA
jgi:UDP-N-acetylglucosamine 2-epimerase